MYRKGLSKRQSKASDSGDYARIANVTDKGGGQTTSGHVKVIVRVRPPNEAESSGNFTSVIRILDEHVLVFDPKEQDSDDFYHGKKRRGRDLNKRLNRDVRFAFDRVFDCDTNNADVYENTTKVILDGILDGYNCSVFAYGATGAGKTFTMLGNNQNPGVIFLTMMNLYQHIDSMKDDKTCDVAVSYLEVYNEQICDLLVPKGYLPIREDPRKGVIVAGLSLHKPKSADELLQMLSFGNKNRTQHPTDANAESSRSHAVFQVFVRQRDRTANISADVRVAKMSLIDLAGSERATVTTNQGARFREGASINKSLLALGNCINALADGKSKGYIPYRNSKLTRLLKDSLGGNCRTVMIAAISPSATSYEDTYNTLNYANRAKNIKAELKRNVLSVDFHISKYAKICDELRLEVSELRTKLKDYESGSLAVSFPPAPSSANEAEIDRISTDMRVIFEDRRSIHLELLELEGKERDLALRLHAKERCLLRVKTINAPSNDKATSKISHMIEMTRMKQERVLSCKQRLRLRMDQNATRVQQVQTEITKLTECGMPTELLECRLKMHHQDIELHDTKRHVRCLQNLGRFQESHASSTERLVLALLKAYHKVYYILQGHHLASSDLVSQYETIQHLVEGEREVAWADQTLNDTQPITDTERPLLDHILKFPTLSSRSLRRSSIMAGVNMVSKGQAAVMSPVISAPPSVMGSACDVPPGICTPGPPPCRACIPARSNLMPRPPIMTQLSPVVTNQLAPTLAHLSNTSSMAATLRHDTPHPSNTSSMAATLRHDTPHPSTSSVSQPPKQEFTEHSAPAWSTSSDNCDQSYATKLASNVPITPQLCAIFNNQRNEAMPQAPQQEPDPGIHTQPEPGPRIHTQQMQSSKLIKYKQMPQPTQLPKYTQRLIDAQQLTPHVQQLQEKSTRLPPYMLQVVQPQNSEVSHDHPTTVLPPGGNPSLDGTFVFMDGIVPLECSPENIELGSRVLNSIIREQTPHRPIPQIAGHTVTLSDSMPCQRQSDEKNVTVPLPAATPLGTNQLLNQSNDIANMEFQTHSSYISSGTVTKCSGPVDKSATVTKRLVMEDGTMTKVSPDIENREPNALLSVKRAMDFSERLASPAGRLTFADAVKSPGVSLKRQQSNTEVRSPLVQCENIQGVRPAKHHKQDKPTSDRAVPSKPRRMIYGSSRSASSTRSQSVMGPRSNINTQKSLHRMGLPSVVDMRENSCKKSTSKQPKYMQLTRAASVKRSSHHRSQSVENSKIPRDVSRIKGPSDENKPAHRQLFNARTKSVSHLPQRERGRFF